MTRFVKTSEIDTQGARTFPQRFYVSDEFFEIEQERIFRRSWLCAGREADIPLAGQYFVRDLGTESAIVVRDHDGAIRALHNVCRHRGTRLCEQASGMFQRSIQCAYHAWTYALDGRLIGAPAMDDVAGFDRSSHALHRASAATWEGFVFVSFAAEQEPIAQTFQPAAGKFARFGLARLRPVRRIDYDVAANWKLIFENYSECFHCPTVHPALVKLSPADSGENDLTGGPILGGFMSIARPGGSMTLSGRACARPVGELLGEDFERIYYYSIFPNMLLSLHHDYVMVHTLWPQAANRTRIECQWLFHPEATEEQGFDPDDAVAFWDQTNRQDWHVCEACQRGIASRAYTPGPYSPRESISAAFDRHVIEVLGDAAGVEPPVGRGTAV